MAVSHPCTPSRTMSKPRHLQISSLPGQPALSPAHKRFNALLGQIEQARKTLQTWQNNIPVFQQAFVQQLLPLQSTLRAERRQHLLALDALFEQPGWTTPERSTSSATFIVKRSSASRRRWR